METNHEHIKISGLQKLSAILHLGSPSSGSMTEAWDEAHTYPRTLWVFSKKEGMPQLCNGLTPSLSTQQKAQAKEGGSKNFTSGITICSQKHPCETFGNKMTESWLYWEWEMTCLAMAQETQTKKVIREKMSCTNGYGNPTDKKKSLVPRGEKLYIGDWVKTQGKFPWSSKGWVENENELKQQQWLFRRNMFLCNSSPRTYL